MDVKCYYSPKFTSTLLSNNDVLEFNTHRKQCCGQSLIKLFDLGEIAEFPSHYRDSLKNQKLDQVTERYDNSYENFILVCKHKSKSNRNIYIQGVFVLAFAIQCHSYCLGVMLL